MPFRYYSKSPLVSSRNPTLRMVRAGWKIASMFSMLGASTFSPVVNWGKAPRRTARVLGIYLRGQSGHGDLVLDPERRIPVERPRGVNEGLGLCAH